METIMLCDLPAPNGIKRNICLIFDDEISLKVLVKLEELGWMWPSNCGKPTQYRPTHPFKLWLYESEMCHSILTHSDALWTEFKVVESKTTTNPLVNLKQLNSNPLSTNCANCGGHLKEPYPEIKFCPKCEP